jgi:hypothetical protein
LKAKTTKKIAEIIFLLSNKMRLNPKKRKIKGDVMAYLYDVVLAVFILFQIIDFYFVFFMKDKSKLDN